MSGKIRLYVEHRLGPAQTIPLDRAQAHYLFSVMRLTTGAEVRLFNGQDGEWLATVTEASKRGGQVSCLAQTASQHVPRDLWLLFAPLKKMRTDFVVEKAVELGVRRLVPVQTRFSSSDRFRRDRHLDHVREAAEQCGATHLPEVEEMRRISDLLDVWPASRRIVYCDERPGGPNAATALSQARGSGEEWAILIGPEGGFADAERARLRDMPNALTVSLGPRILRAETAAVAALTLWQATIGDWS